MVLTQNVILRLMNRFPMLQYFTDRPFGIEIEFYGLDYVLAPIDNNIIKPYCISSRAKDGRNIQELYKDFKIPMGADRESWHFEKDGSVRGKGHTQFGAELTSPTYSIWRRADQPDFKRNHRPGPGVQRIPAPL